MHGNDVRIPIWRSPDDLNIAEDLTEEVVRIYGYEKVEGIPLLSEKHINPRWSVACLLLFMEELRYYAKDLGIFDI